jgi:hypothetical protein
MRHGWFLFFAVALGAAGCGGEQHHAEGPEHHAKGEHGAKGEHDAKGEHHGDGHHEHDLKGPIGDLHGVLAPIWHDKGPDRLTKACDQAKVMREKSAAVEAAPAPAGADAAALGAAAEEMTAAGDALIAACAASGRPDVEAKFSAFHDAFHKAMEKSGGGHHEHHD